MAFFESEADKRLAVEIKCTRTRLEQARRSVGRGSHIYIIRQHLSANAYDCPYKIGQSINPSERVKQLQSKSQYRLSVLTEFPADHADFAECVIHVAFEETRIRNEWFVLDRDALQLFVNVIEFNNGDYVLLRNEIILPHGFWDGTLDLPF